MNKLAISKTAICYWSEEDDSFVVESPLFETIAGVGETPEDAFRVFDDLLDDAYEAYLAGRVPGYDKPGRPTKGYTSFNTDVRPETKTTLRSLSEQFECSMGEVVDFLLFYYEHVTSGVSMRDESGSQATVSDVQQGILEGLANRIEELSELVKLVHEDVHHGKRTHAVSPSPARELEPA